VCHITLIAQGLSSMQTLRRLMKVNFLVLFRLD
jgi:hypothetical protein